MLSLPLVTTEALGDADTDSARAIGNFTGRLCTGRAPDIHIAVLIEHAPIGDFDSAIAHDHWSCFLGSLVLLPPNERLVAASSRCLAVIKNRSVG